MVDTSKGRQGPYGPRTPGTSLLSFEGIGRGNAFSRSFFEVTHTSRWAYSSVGLEHTPDKREVGSSNLPRPTTQPHVGL